MSDELWPLAAWLTAGAVMLGIGLGTVAGVLSPSVALDMAALWPVPTIAVLAGAALWKPARSKPRLLAVPGLVVLTWAVVALAGHLASETWLPSAAADVRADIDTPEAAVRVDLDRGRVDVGVDPTSGYRISSIRAGGAVGPPAVFEQAGTEATSVIAVARDGGNYFRFAGWRIGLTPAVTWAIDMVAPTVEIETAGLDLVDVRLRAADITVHLDEPAHDATLDLTGVAEISVAEGVAVRVSGRASVPETWEESGDGWIVGGPQGGPVWTVVVRQGSAAIISID